MNGEMKCPDCENGYVDRTCGFCNGSGEGMADGSVCQFCKGGSYKEQCERCDGTGELDEEQEWDNLIMDLEMVRNGLRKLRKELK